MQLALPLCSQITAKKTPCKCRSVGIYDDLALCGRHKRFSERAQSNKKYMREIECDCVICCVPLKAETFLARTNCGHMFHRGAY